MNRTFCIFPAYRYFTALHWLKSVKIIISGLKMTNIGFDAPQNRYLIGSTVNLASLFADDLSVCPFRRPSATLAYGHRRAGFTKGTALPALAS
jgi:hypothetical protein